MAINKIELMHRLYGVEPHKKCSECCHFNKYLYRDKNYFKCEIYGETNSEASDWRKKYDACGLFNKEVIYMDVIRLVRGGREKEEFNREPIDGQIGLFDE